MFKKCFKCRLVKRTIEFNEVERGLFSAFCFSCLNRVHKPGRVPKEKRKRVLQTPEERKEKARARNRAYTKRKMAEDPEWARKRFEAWANKNPAYEAIRKPGQLQLGSFDRTEVIANEEALNPWREAEKTALSEWLEENLTKREWDCVQAFAEYQNSPEAAKSLGLRPSAFEKALFSARNKAKGLDR